MKITSTDITEYVEAIEEPRKSDILKLVERGRKLTGFEPKLWGTIIGFGNLHYKYETGNEGDMPLFAFANRKQAITLYISYALEKYEQLKSLGKFTIGKSCLYVKKLADINLDVLESLIKEAIEDTLKISFVTVNPE